MSAEPARSSVAGHFHGLELLDVLSTGLVLLDSQLCVLYANVGGQDLLGVSLRQAHGLPLGDLFAGVEPLVELLHRALQDNKGCAGHELALVPVSTLAAARAPAVVDFTITPLENPLAGRQLLLELVDARARQRIARESESRSRADGSRLMVRQLAHEIKNPLGGLRGAAQLLERELHESRLKEYTTVIISEADRLCSLVDTMLGPFGPPRTRLISVHEICEYVYQLLRSEAPPGVSIERDYDPSLPDGHFDRNEIIQALLNIARNALQALAGSGRLVLRTRVLSNQNLGAHRHRLVACVQVQDDGPGVPDEMHQTLFMPLVTSKAEGTGLGLSVAQDMVSRHQGAIDFESRPGRTVFSLLLPLGAGAMSSAALRVWLVDDDASIRWVLERALRSDGLLPQVFDSAEPVLAALGSDTPDVLITDVRMAGRSGIELLKRVHATHPALPIIVMTAHSDLGTAVSAYESGAFEYLPKPFDIDHAVQLVRRAAHGNARPRSESPVAPPVIAQLLGRAQAMQEVFRAIGRLARSSVNVLVTGESGTGKELVARALHEHSPRAAKPFIALNTSAIAAELLESELFGHEKGAFTGADSLRRGRFEQADGGSLFLDEIGDMSLGLQTRLLRVLAEGEFYRVGGQTPIRVDVRVIAATHQDLEARTRSGKFREDLFHRLDVIRIELPPLRARREDIPDLLQHYLKLAAQELSLSPKSLSAEAGALLAAYSWPGNVRELVNLCRRATALAPGNEIRIADLPASVRRPAEDVPAGAEWTRSLSEWAEASLASDDTPLLDAALPEFERTLVRAALKASQGRRQEAARLLGWGRNTLTRKLKELELDNPEPDS